MATSRAEPAESLAGPITAEIIPPTPSPWRFGLKALLGLMGVCSVQFAAMNYLGVLGGLALGMCACGAAFTVIMLVGMALTGERTRLLPKLDVLIVRLMLAIVILFIGTILAGGGTAAYQVWSRLRIERAVEKNLGLRLQHVQIVRDSRVVIGLHITSVTSGGIAHQAGLQMGEVIVLEGTVEETIERLYQSRGKDVDLNVATGALTQSVENCPQRSVTLAIPP